jgi:hypothetical protein
MVPNWRCAYAGAATVTTINATSNLSNDLTAV